MCIRNFKGRKEVLGHPRKIDFLFVCDKSEITLSDNRDLNWLPLKSSTRRKVINSRKYKKKIKIFIVMQVARRIYPDSHANSSCKFVGFILIASKPVFPSHFNWFSCVRATCIHLTPHPYPLFVFLLLCCCWGVKMLYKAMTGFGGVRTNELVFDFQVPRGIWLGKDE